MREINIDDFHARKRICPDCEGHLRKTNYELREIIVYRCQQCQKQFNELRENYNLRNGIK